MNFSDFYHFYQLKAVHHKSRLWVFIPQFTNFNALLCICYETVWWTHLWPR